MADIRDSKNWSFETKQVHMGQEQPDPATGPGQFPYTPPLLMCLTTAVRGQTGLLFRSREIYTEG